MKDLKVFNNVLLGKWIWRFGKEENALRRGMVVEKYGIVERGWRTSNITTPFGCGLWKSLMKGLWKTSVVIFLLRLGMEVGLTLGHISGLRRAS